MPGLFNVAAEVMIERNGRILLAKRSDGRDHAPGQWEGINGRVEQGETLEQAVVREVREETNLEIEIIQPYHTWHFYRGAEKVEHLGVTFWCRYVSGEVRLDPHEHSEFRWVSIDEGLGLVTNESIKKSLDLLRKISAL